MTKLSNDEPSSDSDDRLIEAAERETIEDRSPPPSPEGEATEAVRAAPTARIPERIGNYHIKRIIASGGMGTVYEATQQKPRRTVAVKVMKQGIASRSALRRFDYEAQILARLRHPGIAQIFEAGTHDDDNGTVPYFAMEYIPNAKPITKFVREKKLGVRERMKLFAQVCDAVQHGHQKGVIHRDLKPSNILVDSSGQVKIIDFGVARGTDSDMAVTTLQTDIGQLIGTLQYMSPEQCEADPHDIDTRSDVYALGVVFFELLTDQLPYDIGQKAIHEATRVIREVQPTRLSALNRTLRGDVETIALKALEKERERRYQSATALGEDIERYLAHEPIKARPPSLGYQLRKFVRRRRVPLAACGVVLLSLGFALDRQIRASNTASMSRMRETAYKVFYAAQPDEALTNPASVIADCTRAIAMDPSLALAYALRAKARLRQGDEAGAWLDGNKAVELDPKSAFAYRTMGYLYLRRGDFDQARAAYNRGFQKFLSDTDLPRDLHNRAHVHTILRDYEQALVFHDGAVALAPKTSSRVFISRALARRFAGKIDGAIEDLNRAVSIDAKKWAVQCNLWIWEMRMLRDGVDDREAAEAALLSAERGHGSAMEKDLVAACRGASEGKAALAAATKPELQCCAYYYLGAKALVDGRTDVARTLLQKCYDLGPNDLPEFHMARWHLTQPGLR